MISERYVSLSKAIYILQQYTQQDLPLQISQTNDLCLKQWPYPFLYEDWRLLNTQAQNPARISCFTFGVHS